jgi:hypothetical protein
MDTIVDVALAIGLPLIVIVLFSLVADKQRREKQSLVVMFVFTATMDAFSMVLAQIVKHPIERFCVNNAVPRFQEDGPSLCIAEAVGIQYFLMSNTFAWLSLSVDLFLKVVMEWKSYQGRTFFLINAAWIFGAPLVPLIMGAVRGIYGYNGNQSWCFHRSGIDIKFTWMIFHLHLLIVTCLGFLLMIPVLWKIIVTTGAANEKARDKGVKNAFLFALKRIGKKLKPLRTSLIFVAEKLFFMISLLYYRGLMYYKTVDYVAAVAVWKGCVWKYRGIVYKQVWSEAPLPHSLWSHTSGGHGRRGTALPPRHRVLLHHSHLATGCMESGLHGDEGKCVPQPCVVDVLCGTWIQQPKRRYTLIHNRQHTRRRCPHETQTHAEAEEFFPHGAQQLVLFLVPYYC